MTMRVYRFRAGAPFDEATLAALSGDFLATIMGSTGGQIVDLLVDDSREDDLIEVMASKDFTFVTADPAAVRAHDFFAGIGSPSKGSMLVGQEDHLVLARPVITEDGRLMVDEDGHVVLHSPDDGPGTPGDFGAATSAANEFARADATAIAKTLVYSGDDLSQVLIYGDEAKTFLNYTKDLSYDMNGGLVEVLLTRASDGATWTKTLSYTGETLDEVLIEAS